MDAATGSTAQARTEGSGAGPATGEWAWILRVLAVVAVFGVVAIARSRQVDVPFRDPHGKLFTHKILSTAELLVAFVAADIVVRWLRRRRRGNSESLWKAARTRWTPYRIAMIAASLAAYQVVYLCYRNLKSWDVFRPPQDALLQRWDKALFLGHSPAVLLHDLLGRDVAARFLAQWYESFSMLVTLALVAAMAFTPTVRSAFVFVVSAMWAWILGAGSYYLIPSLGPFHETPSEFAGLTRTSIQRTQNLYVAQRDHLLAHPHSPDAFAVDDIAGLALAWVSVQLGKLTVFGSWRSPPDRVPNP